MTSPNEVFVSYSHADLAWLERLQVHLAPLQRDGVFSLWDDTRIEPGSQWKIEIRDALDRAHVAVLLISADFLASEFISSNELPPLLAAAENRGTLILPVIVSPCRFVHTPALARFQAVNSPDEPLVRMRTAKREEVFVKISALIEKAFASDSGQHNLSARPERESLLHEAATSGLASSDSNRSADVSNPESTQLNGMARRGGSHLMENVAREPLPVLLKRVLIIVWLVLGTYTGAAGWARLEMEQPLSSSGQEATPVICDGTVFSSKADCAAYERDKQMLALFPWIHRLPAFFGILLVGVGFGGIGGCVQLVGVRMRNGSPATRSNVMGLPLFGSLLATLVLGIVSVIPTLIPQLSMRLTPAIMAVLALLTGTSLSIAYLWVEHKTKITISTEDPQRGR
jgi:hypothetical protein